MADYLIQEAASYRLDEIYRYTQSTSGDKQAEAYIHGMFEIFQKIADQTAISRAIPAEFGVSGYFYHYEHHYIYWKRLASGQVGIVTILHERMHQIERFKESSDS